MITGNTRIYGILADPIAHVRAPEAFNRICAERGVDAVFLPFHVSEERLAPAIEGLRSMENLSGFTLTLPHKVTASEFCDELLPQAALCGAVNAVRREPSGRLVGETFDGIGFVRGLAASGVSILERRILLLGAGGAARAMAYALAEAGVGHIRIANRTPDKAIRLAKGVVEAFPNCEADHGSADASGFDIVANATSLGLSPDDSLPVDPDTLAPGVVVAESIMRPATTALLTVARERGCEIRGGQLMLDHQVLLMADFLGMTASQD